MQPAYTRFQALALIFIAVGCERSQVVPTPSPQQTTIKPAEESPTATAISFRQVTQQSGVEFVNRNGQESGHCSIVESLGGGVGIIDVDHDGKEDLFLPGGGDMAETKAIPLGRPAGVFRNRGGLEFDDVSVVSGVVNNRLYSHGVACGDYDNDGFRDAIVTGYSGLQLFKNLGDGTFEEIAIESGLSDTLWSSSAAWGDITNDGVLDLYVAHYVNWSLENHPNCPGPESAREVCPPREFEGLADIFYTSLADGNFADRSAEFGLAPDGKGLGVLIADFDHDNLPDVYVTNDTVPNVLYANQSGQKLNDVSLISGASLNNRGVPDGSMGVQLLDYNNDGEFDVWVANYERESNALYEGQGGNLFRHVSHRTGITAAGASFVGWGTLCFDADRDGDEDVLVSNGHVIRFPRSAPLLQEALMFENINGQTFRNVSSQVGDYIRSPHMARGSANADLDNDGSLDVVVMHTNEPVDLLKNDCTKGHFLSLELIGTTGSRDPVGATISVTIGEKNMHRQVVGGGSYGSSGSQRLHFGFADNAKSIDRVTVRWPRGAESVFRDIAPNSHLRVIENRGLAY